MRKYHRNSKSNWFFRVIITMLLLIILFVSAVVAFIWNKLDKITYADEIDSQNASGSVSSGQDSTEETTEQDDDFVVDIGSLEISETLPVIPESDVSQDEDVVNILLIGTDERTTEYSTNARADSMILVSINKDMHTVRLVSLERGIGVPILDGELKGEYDLLTHIFRWGGADLLIKTVEHCFKIECDRYVRLNFAAVKDIVDAVGGVDIELSAAEVGALGEWYLKNSSTGRQAPLKTGINHMDGGNALAFARLRSIDSDWQRVERQRRVILAVVDALKDSSLIELNDLADTVLPLIQTNLTKLEIADLILYAPNFLRSEFDQMTIPKQGTYGGMSIRNGGGAFAVDYEINNDLLYRFLYEGATSEALLAE